MMYAEPGHFLGTAQTSPEFRLGRGVKREAPSSGVEELCLDASANSDRRFNKLQGLLSPYALKRLKREEPSSHGEPGRLILDFTQDTSTFQATEQHRRRDSGSLNAWFPSRSQQFSAPQAQYLPQAVEDYSSWGFPDRADVSSPLSIPPLSRPDMVLSEERTFGLAQTQPQEEAEAQKSSRPGRANRHEQQDSQGFLHSAFSSVTRSLTGMSRPTPLPSFSCFSYFHF